MLMLLTESCSIAHVAGQPADTPIGQTLRVTLVGCDASLYARLAEDFSHDEIRHMLLPIAVRHVHRLLGLCVEEDVTQGFANTIIFA